MGLIKQLRTNKTAREAKQSGLTALVVAVLVMIAVDVFLILVIFPRIPDKIWRGWNPQWGESIRSVKATVLIVVDCLVLVLVFWLRKKFIGTKST